MEIVLLLAMVAVGASALFVAFTFRKHVTRDLELLVRKADLDPLRKAASDVSGQVQAVGGNLQKQLRAAEDNLRTAGQRELTVSSDQSKQIGALRDQLDGKLDGLDRHVRRLDRTLARQTELLAEIEKRLTGQATQGGDPREMDALELALLQAEAYVARGGWSQPPRLFSLARKSSLVAADSELEDKLKDAEPDALIPVEQADLPAGEPFDILATIRWPEGVVGCVLVTEIVTLPPEAGKDAPGDQAAAEQWARAHSGGKAARLAVGVTRAGGYLCGLRLEGDDDVQVGADLADDIVAALLGTF